LYRTYIYNHKVYPLVINLLPLMKEKRIDIDPEFRRNDKFVIFRFFLKEPGYTYFILLKLFTLHDH